MNIINKTKFETRLELHWIIFINSNDGGFLGSKESDRI